MPPGAPMSLSGFEPVLFVKREQPRVKQVMVLHLLRKSTKGENSAVSGESLL